MSDQTRTDRRSIELAHRRNGRIEVRLLWHGGEDVAVVVSELESGRSFELAVEPRRALETFYSPFLARAARDAEQARAAGQGPVQRTLR